MSRTILVTSCKGGVGKSTVAANLCAALSLFGASVLLIDMDLGNRSLDLILGCEDRVVYDISDVCLGRADIRDAVLRMEKPRGFLFCPAPFLYRGGITHDTLMAALDAARDAFAPDFIFLDTSGGADVSVELCASVSDEGLIVSSRNPTALRAAGKSASVLDGLGVPVQHLVVNGYDLSEKQAGERAGILEMIDATGLPLIGIVPEDPPMAVLQEKGKLCTEAKKDTVSARAFRNIARRLGGENIRLLEGVGGIREKKRRQILLGK